MKKLIKQVCFNKCSITSRWAIKVSEIVPNALQTENMGIGLINPQFKNTCTVKMSQKLMSYYCLWKQENSFSAELSMFVS